MRKQRYQKGSLQRRKYGRHWVWVVLWYERGHRRHRTLGWCSEMSRPEAEIERAKIVQSLNGNLLEKRHEARLFREYVECVYLPFRRGKWKDSTRGTTEQRIRQHLMPVFGRDAVDSITRHQLQGFLNDKSAQGISASVLGHVRWDLRAIFALAVQDRIIDRNPAESLYTPRAAVVPERRVMTEEDVRTCLSVLDLRERLIVKLAIFASLRPGEIFGLQWGSIKPDHAEIVQRVYRGRLDSPKTVKSRRTAGFSPGIMVDLAAWRELSVDTSSEAWVFPSETLKTPLSKDNCWRRCMEPRLRPVGLAWANFQVMRRTYHSESHKCKIDPKVAADQAGHGMGVALNDYVQTDLSQRLEALAVLERAVLQ